MSKNKFVTHNQGFKLATTNNRLLNSAFSSRAELENLFGPPFEEFGYVPRWDVATGKGVCFRIGVHIDGNTVLFTNSNNPDYNKTVEEWVKENIFNPNNWLTKKRVPSSTSPNVFYEVTKYPSRVTCTCLGYQNRQYCKHTKSA